MSVGHLPERSLWQQIVEQLDEGLLIFDDRNVITFANTEAARLLGYEQEDVLGLTLDDFLALCQAERLDAPRLAAALKGDSFSADEAYTVATISRRLEIIPMRVFSEENPMLTLLLEDIPAWRDTLIADIALGELRSPLTFATSYADTLLRRLDDESVHTFELRDLARIIRDSIRQAQTVWETLVRLRSSHPEHNLWSHRESVMLQTVIKNAMRELRERPVQGLSRLQLDLPSDLPPVYASPELLHHGICALFEGAINRQVDGGQMLISAHAERFYLQIDLTPSSPSGGLRAYLFDELPLAISEQIIVHHGGRIWFEDQDKGGMICHVALPTVRDA